MFPQVIKTFYILAVIGHSCRCVWQLSHTHWGWHRVRESYRWSFSGLVRGLRGQKTPWNTQSVHLRLFHLFCCYFIFLPKTRLRVKSCRAGSCSGRTHETFRVEQIPIVHLAVEGQISEQLCRFVTSFIDKSWAFSKTRHRLKLCFHKVLFICRIFRAPWPSCPGKKWWNSSRGFISGRLTWSWTRCTMETYWTL